MESIFMQFYRKELDEKKSEPCIAWGWDVRFLDVDCGGEEVKKSDGTTDLLSSSRSNGDIVIFWTSKTQTIVWKILFKGGVTKNNCFTFVPSYLRTFQDGPDPRAHRDTQTIVIFLALPVRLGDSTLINKESSMSLDFTLLSPSSTSTYMIVCNTSIPARAKVNLTRTL